MLALYPSCLRVRKKSLLLYNPLDKSISPEKVWGHLEIYNLLFVKSVCRFQIPETRITPPLNELCSMYYHDMLMLYFILFLIE